ncbi:MAG: hypothetical protein RLZZ163_433 [Actinomycetota bacterium]|jgi:hypothetical protein
MPWYELTTDVMVAGTPRSAGEILELSLSDGQLLSGLGRAQPSQPAQPVEPASEPAIEQPSVTSSRLTRRTKSPSTKE